MIHVLPFLRLNVTTSPCGTCATCFCCELEPAALLPSDITRISSRTGVAASEFVDRSGGPLAMPVLRFVDGARCYFLDTSTRRCRIYEVRPLDCRLFPLDVIEEGGAVLLIRYRTNHCGFDSVPTPVLLRKAEKILPQLSVDAVALQRFARHANPGGPFSRLEYEIVRELRSPRQAS